jgi:hypothetical protein
MVAGHLLDQQQQLQLVKHWSSMLVNFDQTCSLTCRALSITPSL